MTDRLGSVRKNIAVHVSLSRLQLPNSEATLFFPSRARSGTNSSFERKRSPRRRSSASTWRLYSPKLFSLSTAFFENRAFFSRCTKMAHLPSRLHNTRTERARQSARAFGALFATTLPSPWLNQLLARGRLRPALIDRAKRQSFELDVLARQIARRCAARWEAGH